MIRVRIDPDRRTIQIIDTTDRMDQSIHTANLNLDLTSISSNIVGDIVLIKAAIRIFNTHDKSCDFWLTAEQFEAESNKLWTAHHNRLNINEKFGKFTRKRIHKLLHQAASYYDFEPHDPRLTREICEEFVTTWTTAGEKEHKLNSIATNILTKIGIIQTTTSAKEAHDLQNNTTEGNTQANNKTTSEH